MDTFVYMKGILVVLVVLMSSLSAFSQEPMTLNDCVELAWQNNLQVKQSELSVDVAAADLKNSRANVLPNLNGFASHNYNWGQRIDPFTNQFANTRVQSNSFGVSSDITLFNGFRNYQDVKVKEAAIKFNEFDLEAQKNTIALAVASGFVQVLMAEALVETSTQQVRITEEQLDRVSKLVEAGSINAASKYELEAQLGRDESNLVQNQNNYYLSLLRLKQLMMIPADQEVALVKPDIDPEVDNSLESAQTVYAYAESAMPEVKRAEYSLMQWDRQLQVAKSGRYPTLTLSGSLGTGYSGLASEVASVDFTGNEVIGFTSAGDDVLIPQYSTNLSKVGFGQQLGDNFNQFVGLSLNVPIFNRFRTNTTIAQSKINQDMAALQLEQEKLTLRQSIESARADAVAAKELWLANEKSVQSAQKAFEFTSARFEAGATNITEFNVSKNNLRISEVERSRSLYDYIFKSKVLDFYMGRPLGFE